jgi:hypothetical protein
VVQVSPTSQFDTALPSAFTVSLEEQRPLRTIGSFATWSVGI